MTPILSCNSGMRTKPLCILTSLRLRHPLFFFLTQQCVCLLLLLLLMGGTSVAPGRTLRALGCRSGCCSGSCTAQLALPCEGQPPATLCWLAGLAAGGAIAARPSSTSRTFSTTIPKSIINWGVGGVSAAVQAPLPAQP